MTALDAQTRPPLPHNEPVQAYAPGSAERRQLARALENAGASPRPLPMWLDGQTSMGTEQLPLACPHRHRQVLGSLAAGGPAVVQAAIDAAMAARPRWAAMDFDARAAVFLRAACLLAGPYRYPMLAATMLGQSKTVHQAEIDAVAELCDFWRFNVAFAARLQADQPLSPPGAWNRLDYRPLDGFVLAVAPFNFTAIAGNLAAAPALMGNTVVLKPAPQAALSVQVMMEVLAAAGLPAGVINVVQAPGSLVGDVALADRNFAGLHFTGSTATFGRLWQQVGRNLDRYRAYPRLVGETGGKNFVIAHPSCSVPALVAALVRGAFEYQGQKCSAASRAYVPEELWPEVAPRLEAAVRALKVGDVGRLENFMGALIDARAFARVGEYLSLAHGDPSCRVWLGGSADDREGFFVQPTVVLVDDPRHRLMREEIFGPVLTVHRYRAADFADVLKLCDDTGDYALTGAIFARDQAAVAQATAALRFAAGNLVINDKPTAAVVGQQPFGGGRRSGTNDKAGCALNLTRWVSARTIKETLVPGEEVDYPHQLADAAAPPPR